MTKPKAWDRGEKEPTPADAMVRCRECGRVRAISLVTTLRTGQWLECCSQICELMSEDEVDEVRAQRKEAKA